MEEHTRQLKNLRIEVKPAPLLYQSECVGGSDNCHSIERKHVSLWLIANVAENIRTGNFVPHATHGIAAVGSDFLFVSKPCDNVFFWFLSNEHVT